MKQNGKFWLTVQEKDSSGKTFAYVVEISSSENIFHSLARIKNADFGSIFTTRKKAAEVAAFWNDCAARNGVYKFE
jgi:hypothetical protein